MIIVGPLVVALVAAVLSIRILKQYERGVVFRLGRVGEHERGPGLTSSCRSWTTSIASRSRRSG
jgi:regulator of protease activity HflC (stomatin/prohibitin superfamily)